MTHSDDKSPDGAPEKTRFIPKAAKSKTAPPATTDTEDAWFAGGSPEAADTVDTAPVPEQPSAPSSWDDVPAPSPGWDQPPAPEVLAPARLEMKPPRDITPPEPTQFMPAREKASERIEVGAVLNGTYRVTRLIARGGMGEVFEGENINSDERVAIKVILPHLSQDPKVSEMFRSEDRIHRRLSHEALVKYRGLGKAASCLYIVTEYIDGPTLYDVYTTLKPSLADLTGLLRRMAAGLEAAHKEGAFHRDISLDNILLPDGKLSQAKIIDFGIAKDDQGSGTIIGDGFAGRLAFAAPEQFGDFGREIGPWTDIYSLALVMLWVCAGKPFNMGATLVEAVESRRQVPDVSVAPEALRRILARMLAPNPKDRYRSMTEVLEDMSRPQTTAVSAPPPAKPKVKTGAETGAKTTAKPVDLSAVSGWVRKNIYLVGAVATVVVLGLVGLMVLPMLKGSGPRDAAVATQAATEPAALSPFKIRLAVARALDAQVDCAWLDVAEPQGAPGAMTMDISGVAQRPGLIPAIVEKAAGAGVVANVNVNLLKPEACGVINSFRKFRTPLTAPQTLLMDNRSYTLSNQPEGCDTMAIRQAKTVTTITSSGKDFVMLGVEPDGKLAVIPGVGGQAIDRQNLRKLTEIAPSMATVDAGGKFSFSPCVDEATVKPSDGNQALMLVVGDGPVSLPGLKPSNATAAVSSGWPAQFEQAATQHGWRTEMVWFHVGG